MNNWPQQGIHENVPFHLYRECDITQADDHLTVTGKSVSKSLICDFIKDAVFSVRVIVLFPRVRCAAPG